MLTRNAHQESKGLKKSFFFQKRLFNYLGLSLLVWGLGACSTNKASETTDPSADSMATQSTEESISPELLGEQDPTTNQISFNQSAEDPIFGKRRAPEVASKPFEKSGRWMNSYYFVRSSDESWESISQLLYGRPDRGSLLSTWNGGAQSIRTGKIIYYNSPTRPDDSETMKVISDDFGFSFDQVEIKSGDSLSAIGLKLYGDAQTWRELASLNPEITSPDIIVPGQVIRVQKANFDTKAVFEQLLAQAQSSPFSQTNQQPETEQVATPQVETAAQVAQQEPLKEETDQAMAPPTPEPKDNQTLLIKLTISLLLLAGVALIIRKRIQAKKLQSQSWENQASVMTKVSN
jgi:hypothetical protein